MTLALDDASDGALAALARSGTQAAYRKLTERHREAVYRLVRSAMGEADEALDVTQETFVSAFGALDRYDPARPFRAWIARIALNKARDWGRRRAVRRMFNLGMPDHAAQTVPDEAVGADRAAEDRQALNRVAAAIAQLPARLKEALLLRTIEGMSQAEVAATLGVSEKTVETRLYRARQKLTEAMREDAPRRV
ncbi:sigma-70 family RNA polymerase sigma factor [Novosphingobium sp.]|uniref:RNA polymerase sigma factor n=1 Tax=Novosphingobium sp. TaxID=1874826 RepID=UPI0025FF39CB|nr:sigma-70 family RNA polymerase sigma factor [Novosphingobium sp.]